MSFVHLHVHTEYSLLDGMSRISELPAYVRDMGMNALAITDHGAMFGVVDFYKECKKQGIKPIIGCEVYTAARLMTDKDPDLDKQRGHLVLLAENNDGYKNLCKIVSAGYIDGFYYKPRIDKALLRQYSEGLICLSACMAGNVQRLLLYGDYEGAKAEALELRDIFGSENFFLEVQNHGLSEDRIVIEGLKRLSAETGIRIAATNDAHYIRREDAKAHEVLLAIQTGKDLEDEDRMRFECDEFYMKSEREMRDLFLDMPETCDITQEIADRCNVEFTFGEYHLPEFVPPEGYTNTEYLRTLCYEGLERRYGSDAACGIEVNGYNYKERLESELAVIESMGFVEYFLIVWDFIHYAKSNGIAVGPGRGSAAGSVVAYSLDITEIDPVKYGLIFERFLNPERVSMPDIDVDFCIERRQEVIDYVVEKYGKDRVSQIITFGTLSARAVIKDVARVMGASYAEGDSLSKAIPQKIGMTISKALDINHELRDRYDNEKEVREILDMAMALEGLPRHASTHAAGIVISKLPLNEYLPLYASSKGIATQFNMTTVEELGLLKMDFLGLRNLTVLQNALELIQQNKGVSIDFHAMEYDDPAVYELISSGNTQGVFQLESGGMTNFMKELVPTCFEDIIAGISLYRPGPMDSIPKYVENKKHPENITYVDPHLEPILGATYGCLVYQEQVMQIVRDLGGYSYGRSDLVRRAMSKKKKNVMLEEKEYFINGKKYPDGTVEIPGCVANGIPAEAAEVIFEDMVSFAEYAFNKSHAAAYAVIAYETAYLKTYYPLEFMSALMSSVLGESRHISKYIKNCNEMGIKVLPPSVLSSGNGFTIEGDSIRYGLEGVKNVGTGIANAIIEGREKHGLPRDFYEFIDSVDPAELNKKAIESLIKAGAFDEIEPNRAVLMAIYEEAVQDAQREAKSVEVDQISLFDMQPDVMDSARIKRDMPRLANFDKKTLLSMEKEMLGVYLSGHPLDTYAAYISECEKSSMYATTAEIFGSEEIAQSDQNLANERIFNDGERICMVVIVNNVKKVITKRNQEMARLELEDYYGVIEAIVFPSIFDRYRSKLKNDAVLFIKGRISFSDDKDPEILIEEILDVDATGREVKTEAAEGTSGIEEGVKKSKSGTENAGLLKLRIDLGTGSLSAKDKLNLVAEIIEQYPGEAEVLVYLPNGKCVKSNSKVKISDGLISDMVALLGEDNVKY